MITDFELGRYCSTRKLGSLPTKRLTGRVVFLTSLGSVGRLKGNWQNYPTGSPLGDSKKPMKSRLGTLQGELSFWKGQKREPIGGYNERTI